MEQHPHLHLVSTTAGCAEAESEGEAASTKVESRRTRTIGDFGDVLTVEEAAEVLRIGRSTAYDLARRWRSGNPSGLPVIEVGRFLRVPKSALEALLARPGHLFASAVPVDE